jgi:hypothetical protein
MEEKAVECLKSDGVIIWDNSERKSYKKGVDLLKSKGFKQIEFQGMTPILPNISYTSVFYRDKNCLSI